MFRFICEDPMMLRFSNAKSSMLYNLLSVDEALMFVFEALLEKKTSSIMSVPVKKSVHFLTGTYITFYFTIREMRCHTRNVIQTQVKLANNNRHSQQICCLFCRVSIEFSCAVQRLAEDLFVSP